MDFTKLVDLATKDVTTLVLVLLCASFILLYFKYVKYPNDLLVEDLKVVKRDVAKIKEDLKTLEDSFDTANQTRIAEATRNEQTLEKIEELRSKVSKIEERINDLRVELASIPHKK